MTQTFASARETLHRQTRRTSKHTVNQLVQDNQAPRNQLSRPFICTFIVVDIIQKPAAYTLRKTVCEHPLAPPDTYAQVIRYPHARAHHARPKAEKNTKQ